MKMATAAGDDVKAGSSSSSMDRNQERRNRVVLGNLPEDFLRPDEPSSSSQGTSSASQQEIADRQLAIQLQSQQLSGVRHQHHMSQSYAGQLIITIVEASLSKNYGMTRMDPYVRLRVGHTVYETHADPSGGKTPRWNKRIQCYLPTGFKTLSLEIYDECSLTMDELVAYGSVNLPECVFRGESVDEWYQLSGKQGDNKEGSIHLLLSLLPMNITPMTMAVQPTFAGYHSHSRILPHTSVVPVGAGQMPLMVVPAYGVPGYAPINVYTAPANVPAAAAAAPLTNQPKPLSPEEMKEIQMMFPSLDHQVIQSVVDACGGRRDAIIDSLLQLSDN